MKWDRHTTVVATVVAACVLSANAHALDDSSFDRTQLPVSHLDFSDDHSGTNPSAVAETQKQLLRVDRDTSTPIICLKTTRAGSRIATHQCKSVADWEAEFASKYVRRFLLEM